MVAGCCTKAAIARPSSGRMKPLFERRHPTHVRKVNRRSNRFDRRRNAVDRQVSSWSEGCYHPSRCIAGLKKYWKIVCPTISNAKMISKKSRGGCVFGTRLRRRYANVENGVFFVKKSPLCPFFVGLSTNLRVLRSPTKISRVFSNVLSIPRRKK